MGAPDTSLELLIKLGVIGQKDAEAVRGLLVEIEGNTKKASVAATELTKVSGDMADAESEVAEKTEKASLNHRALHVALHNLNKFIPELGGSLAMLSRGLNEATLAEEGVTVATREMIVSMGPLVILFLSIQAATEYWSLYKDSVASAAKVQGQMFDKLITDQKTALKAQDELNEAMHPKPDAVKKFEEDLKLRETQVKESTNRRRELNRVAQEKEEADAKAAGATAEDVGQIRLKWKAREAELSAVEKNALVAAERSAAEEAVKLTEANLAKAREASKKIGEEVRVVVQNGSPEQVAAVRAREQAALAEVTRLDQEAKAAQEFANKTNAEAAERSRANRFQQETDREVFGAQGVPFAKVPEPVGSSEAAGIRGFHPSGNPNETIEQLTQALHYSEQQKQALIQRIHEHAVSSAQAWERLDRAYQDLAMNRMINK